MCLSSFHSLGILPAILAWDGVVKIIAWLFLVLNSVAFAGEDLTQIRNALLERREEVKAWALECADGSYSEKIGECHQWDVTLFAGLGCLAATLADDQETIAKRCGDVKNAQGVDGRWWRGPTKVDKEHENSFSRDMARGVHAYFIARAIVSQDPNEVAEIKKSALEWLEWIGTDEAGNKLCREFTQNRCNITIGAKNLFYEVYSALGIMPKDGSKIIKKINRSKWYLKTIFLLETKLSQKGFPRHLKASSVLFYRLLNKEKKDKRLTKILDKTAKWLYKKDENNLLMDFLANGMSVKLGQEVLKRCPAMLPRADILSRDFQWQRTWNDEIQNYSDGHDCVYLLNLMIAKIDNKLNW